jgi:hypothetical protein
MGNAIVIAEFFATAVAALTRLEQVCRGRRWPVAAARLASGVLAASRPSVQAAVAGR